MTCRVVCLMCVVSVAMMEEESNGSFSWVRRVGGHALARTPWWNCWSRTGRVLLEINSSCDCSVVYDFASYVSLDDGHR